MTDPVFEIARSFDAPLTLVWEMYAKEEHLRHWWGPKGFTWIASKLDFRPGGAFHYGMRAPTGQEMWGRFDYRAIEPLRRLEFTSAFCDPAGEVIRAPFAAKFPLRVLNDIRFSEADGGTTLLMTGRPFEAPDDDKEFFRAMFASMQQGFAGTLGQLEDYLRSLA